MWHITSRYPSITHTGNPYVGNLGYPVTPVTHTPYFPTGGE